MSLFSSLNVGLQSILTNQAALQTTGHNISNANTPGYSRQRVDFSTLPPQDFVFAQLGTGVGIGRIERAVDESLNVRLTDANSSLGNLKVRQETLERIESVFNELKDNSLSNTIAKFFSGLEDVANNPQDLSTRTAAISQGRVLSESVNELGTRLRDLRKNLNDTVRVQVNDLNRAAQEIADLNEQIQSAENAGVSFGSANDLRDQREQLVRQIAEVVNVKTQETPQGALNVLTGSNYLVFGKQAFTLGMQESVDEGVKISTPLFEATGTIPELRGGTLHGTIVARDQIIPGFLHDLDNLARGIIFEVNRAHVEGMGLQRFGSITSVNGVAPNAVPVGGAPMATPATVTGIPSTTSITDSSLIGNAPGFFDGLDIVMQSGPNAGLRRRVLDFDGSTGTLFFDRAFPDPIAAGDKFQISALPLPISNGSFDLRIVNELTGKIEVFNIEIDADKLPSPPPSGDSTLDSVIAEINAETGAVFPPGTITASRTTDNQLKIESSSSSLKIAFGKDTSGFLASIGLNTLFTGDASTTMSLNPLIEDNPKFLAAATGLETGDNTNVRRMADLRNSQVLDDNSATFEEFYQGVVGDMAVQTQEAKDRFEHQSLLTTQVENERERISGVNLDEEAVNLITFQRSFQASARFLSVVDELLATLINSV